MPDVSVVARALDALQSPGVPVSEVEDSDAGHPGLYALHGDQDCWTSLGLGKRPDLRPLYIGKAESSFVTRDLKCHFGLGGRGRQSPTGSSTLRRSLGALLAADLDLVGMPRNPANPGHYANFGFSEEGDARLSAWMGARLSLSLWPHADTDALDGLETAVLERVLPPLNISKISTAWTPSLRAARKRLADEAREWVTD